MKYIARIFGGIPYTIRIFPCLKLEKINRYRITTNSPMVQVELRSLDRISRLDLQLVKPRIQYQGPWKGKRDSEVSLSWSWAEGWWIEGAQTGRRTRPMPRLVGALLCGVLIWIYPELFELALNHAEKTKNYNFAYLILIGVTAILSALIAFYMWLGFKSGPSGLEHALRQFSNVFGNKDETNGETNSTDTKDKSDK